MDSDHSSMDGGGGCCCCNFVYLFNALTGYILQRKSLVACVATDVSAPSSAGLSSQVSLPTGRAYFKGRPVIS